MCITPNIMIKVSETNVVIPNKIFVRTKFSKFLKNVIFLTKCS